MLSGFELRFEKSLRQKIQDQMGEYINELDSIDASRPNALALFLEARMRYSTFEDVLFLMEEVEKELQE